ncbi:MAG: hypothetical protein QM756_02280 [Polyangiaceae bacterium]
MKNTAATKSELRKSDLRPADVLLSRGEGIVSDSIAKNDGGQYSHGAVWSGDGIVQATSAGITHTPFSGSHGVYRRRELTEAGAQEVVELALAELKGRYAYGELVMLGVLFMSGIRVRGAWGSRALEAIGGPKAEKLKAWLDENEGKKVRVCTELVASCFFRAADKAFALEILPVPKRPAPRPTTALAGLQPLGSDEDDTTRGRDDVMGTESGCGDAVLLRALETTVERRRRAADNAGWHDRSVDGRPAHRYRDPSGSRIQSELGVHWAHPRLAGGSLAGVAYVS